MGRVFIVIPMYNAKQFIDNAVRSALAQKEVDTTIVLVDHGSKDGTFDYVQRRYGNLSNVEIIGLKRIPNEIRSASRPLNNGMRLVAQKANDSDWVMRLDADDVLAEDDTISKALKSYDGKCLLIAGSMLFINSYSGTAQEYCQDSRYNSVRLLRNGAAYAYPHHSTLISIKLLKKILDDDSYCYCEKIGYGEDLDYTLRLLNYCKEDEMCFSNVPMIIKELSGDTITNSVDFKTLIYDHYVIFKRNKCLSKGLFVKIIFWYTLETTKVGKLINSKRKPPAGKYMKYSILNFDDILKLKNRWVKLEE